MTCGFHIARGRGEALLQLGRYEDARPELRRAADLSQRPYDNADVRGLLGELAYKLGGDGRKHRPFTRMQSGNSASGSREAHPGSCWGIARESAVQLAHRLFPGRLHRGSPDPSADLANRLLGRLEYGYYCNNVDQAAVGVAGGPQRRRSGCRRPRHSPSTTWSTPMTWPCSDGDAGPRGTIRRRST